MKVKIRSFSTRNGRSSASLEGMSSLHRGRPIPDPNSAGSDFGEPSTRSLPVVKTDKSGPVFWRALEATDLSDLVSLLRRIEEVDNPPYRTTEGEIARWLKSNFAWNGVVGIAQDGELRGHIVCYGHAALLRNSDECLCQGGVDPLYRSRGLGEQVIRWQTEAGRGLLHKHASGRGRISVNVDADHDSFEHHLQQMGFKWSNSTHELRRELIDIPPMPDLGSYREIRRWDPALDDDARRLYNRIIEKPINDYQKNREQWQQQLDSFNSDWSFVALDKTGDRPQLVGLVIVGSYSEDWDVLGWKEGYIDLLGVTDSWSTNEISQALVVSSMKAQLEAGMDKVATGVASADAGQVVRLYEELGFDRSFETRTYSYDL